MKSEKAVSEYIAFRLSLLLFVQYFGTFFNWIGLCLAQSRFASSVRFHSIRFDSFYLDSMKLDSVRLESVQFGSQRRETVLFSQQSFEEYFLGRCTGAVSLRKVFCNRVRARHCRGTPITVRANKRRLGFDECNGRLDQQQQLLLRFVFL